MFRFSVMWYYRKYTKFFKKSDDYRKAFETLNSLADQEILNLTKPSKPSPSEDDYEMRDDSKYRGLGGTILKSLFPNMIE